MEVMNYFFDLRLIFYTSPFPSLTQHIKFYPYNMMYIRKNIKIPNHCCLGFHWIKKMEDINSSFLLFAFVLWGRITLRSPGCPETPYVEQAVLIFSDHPSSASQVLKLPCIPMTEANKIFYFLSDIYFYANN